MRTVVAIVFGAYQGSPFTPDAIPLQLVSVVDRRYGTSGYYDLEAGIDNGNGCKGRYKLPFGGLTPEITVSLCACTYVAVGNILDGASPRPLVYWLPSPHHLLPHG
jgi:hypothetical protein